MTTNLSQTQADIIRSFSQRFRGWQDFHQNRTIKKPYWRIDAQLQASVTSLLGVNSITNAQDFAIYCLENLDNHQLALADKHLSAYLENIGYTIAKSVFKTLRERQNSNQLLLLENSLDAVYQYAWLAASNPRNFYENFQRKSPYLLRYTEVKMKGVIHDGIFASKNTRISGYGLLRKLGPRQRINALSFDGHTEPLLSQYCLVWECFNEICTAVRGRISPNQEHWLAIAKRYNKLSHQSPIDSSQAQKWLHDFCIPAAREYLFPKIESIDVLNEDDNAYTKDLVDVSTLPDKALEQQEVRQLVNRLMTKLSSIDIFQELQLEEKKVLFLRYGLEMTQVEVAREMSWLDRENRPLNSTVCRCEDRVVPKLLKQICIWVEQQQTSNNYPYNIVLNSHIDTNFLKEMKIKPAVGSLLHKYYLEVLNSIFEQVLSPVKVNNQQTRELNETINNENVLRFVEKISELESSSILANNLINSHQLIIQQIQANFDITLQTGGIAAEKVMVLVLDWLKINVSQPNN
ncbi:hypothetical protein H6G33_34210 [Calothrix sp. FACHB-1219]|uniref:hypothetical protein n=1 Tax=unclassified Calothrix TaxID=2619626 RepID=UPI001682ED79|nr:MULTISPECIES: hypothetical protein [unclassified Calothrix]MBD2207427.1 hypothetical protein [Calothrix sp. FACHB-168]MBD2222003.1 hypothetical protein [Calothrix sp. FACHB-1219]